MGIAAFRGELAGVSIEQVSASEIQPMPLQVAEPLVFVPSYSIIAHLYIYNSIIFGQSHCAGIGHRDDDSGSSSGQPLLGCVAGANHWY